MCVAISRRVVIGVSSIFFGWGRIEAEKKECAIALTCACEKKNPTARAHLWFPLPWKPCGLRRFTGPNPPLYWPLLYWEVVMAIYHANIKAFSRGKGESSVAAAAYRAGIDLTDTTKRTEHRYSQRKGVRAFHMLAPTGVPAWCLDPNVFWDANEAWESRANARVARELEVSLPAELDDMQREQLAISLGQELVDRYKTVV